MGFFNKNKEEEYSEQEKPKKMQLYFTIIGTVVTVIGLIIALLNLLLK